MKNRISPVKLWTTRLGYRHIIKFLYPGSFLNFMYKIKSVPEDFFVWEIPVYELSDDGGYSYFWLRKTDWNTVDAVKRISDKLNIPVRYVGFAGSKDKVAVTEQVISVFGVKVDRVLSLDIEGVSLSFIGRGKRPISLGDLMGNRFRITVRNLPKHHAQKSLDRIPNLFGPQRFSENNVAIGRFLVKKNFFNAVKLVDQRCVHDYLQQHPGDFVGALRQLPLKLRKMYVHAYQSFLWNRTVEELLKSLPLKDQLVPIVGFGFVFGNDKVSKILRKVLSDEGINPRDFIIKQLPELSAEGSVRSLFVRPENFFVVSGADDLNPGKFKDVLTFSLPKGSYATVVVDYLYS